MKIEIEPVFEKINEAIYERTSRKNEDVADEFEDIAFVNGLQKAQAIIIEVMREDARE